MRFSENDAQRFCGADRTRTDDFLLAKQALYQLSYSPVVRLVGLGRFELPTSRLSGVRSNQLSYRPLIPARCAIWILTEQRRKERPSGALSVAQDRRARPTRP